jgi:hypothetical protein
MDRVLMVGMDIFGCIGAAGSGRHVGVRHGWPGEKILDRELEVMTCEPDTRERRCGANLTQQATTEGGTAILDNLPGL